MVFVQSADSDLLNSENFEGTVAHRLGLHGAYDYNNFNYLMTVDGSESEA